MRDSSTYERAYYLRHGWSRLELRISGGLWTLFDEADKLISCRTRHRAQVARRKLMQQIESLQRG